MTLRFHTKMVEVVSCAEGWRREQLSQSLKDGRAVTAVTDETLNRIRTAINAEIEELHCNMGKHSKEVQTNAIMIVEGLRRALRIVEEIFWKDGERHDG